MSNVTTFDSNEADQTLKVNNNTKNTSAVENRNTQIKPVMAEYVWRGGEGEVDLRSKTRVLMIELDENNKPKGPVDLPIWNYDGSSTNQASADESEVILNPCAVYTDPFRGAPHVMVLCDCFNAKTKDPLENNTRPEAYKAFEEYKSHEAVYGIEQEYVLMKDGYPLNWWSRSEEGKLEPPKSNERHYCGTGSVRARKISELHMQACLVAGINMSGMNSEVMPSQMEYQVGPVDGLSCSDQVWMSRYLLNRICESDGLTVCYDPRVIEGEWNGNGCHVNMSTKEMREENGLDKIMTVMPKLMKGHDELVGVCGVGSKERLTGKHETSSYEKFTFGIGDRTASVRVPNMVELSKKGYFEDRRPSGNMDPYLVTSTLLKQIVQ